MPFLRELPLEEIRATADQPRKSFYAESLEDLAASIRERGVLEPIVVRPCPMVAGGGGIRYEIVMGERRFRASKLAGRETIPAIIKHMNDEEAAADALLENFQREDLNPVDKARAVQGLLQFMNMERICRTLGVSETTVRRLMDLLTLPEAIQNELVARPDSGQTSAFNEGHARALQPINADPAAQALLVDKVKQEKLSVGHLEQIVAAILQFPSKKSLFLHVSGGVSEQITRSLAAHSEQKKPYRAPGAKEHLKAIDKRMNSVAELLDDRIAEHLTLEELNQLLALATIGARQLEAFCHVVRDTIEHQDIGFREVYTHCPLCGRVELVGGLRCSVCRSILRRCYDCVHYVEESERCRVAVNRVVDVADAEDPSEASVSYQCRQYKPKVRPKSLPMAASSSKLT